MGNLVFLGPPGAGKGTQAKLLSHSLGLPQVSPGDILRAAVKHGTPMGLKAKQCMDQGGLVPDEVVVGIVRERLALDDCVAGFILDGFPRTVVQARALDAMLGAVGKKIDRVLSIEVDREELVQRMVGRRVCSGCGRGFHVKFDPPAVSGVCDACGAQLVQRADDVEETVVRRLDVYLQQTSPLVDYYAAGGSLSSLSGSGTVEDIQGRIMTVVSGARW